MKKVILRIIAAIVLLLGCAAIFVFSRKVYGVSVDAKQYQFHDWKECDEKVAEDIEKLEKDKLGEDGYAFKGFGKEFSCGEDDSVEFYRVNFFSMQHPREIYLKYKGQYYALNLQNYSHDILSAAVADIDMDGISEICFLCRDIGYADGEFYEIGIFDTLTKKISWIDCHYCNYSEFYIEQPRLLLCVEKEHLWNQPKLVLKELYYESGNGENASYKVDGVFGNVRRTLTGVKLEKEEAYDYKLDKASEKWIEEELKEAGYSLKNDPYHLGDYMRQLIGMVQKSWKDIKPQEVIAKFQSDLEESRSYYGADRYESILDIEYYIRAPKNEKEKEKVKKELQNWVKEHQSEITEHGYQRYSYEKEPETLPGVSQE